METKHLSSMRLTLTAKRLLKELSRRYGLSMTGMLELLLRQQAKREGITESGTPDARDEDAASES